MATTSSTQLLSFDTPNGAVVFMLNPSWNREILTEAIKKSIMLLSKTFHDSDNPEIIAVEVSRLKRHILQIWPELKPFLGEVKYFPKAFTCQSRHGDVTLKLATSEQQNHSLELNLESAFHKVSDNYPNLKTQDIEKSLRGLFADIEFIHVELL